MANLFMEQAGKKINIGTRSREIVKGDFFMQSISARYYTPFQPDCKTILLKKINLAQGNAI